MKFNIKDINYIGIIIALLIALFALNNQYKNDSYTFVNSPLNAEMAEY